ncbi:MAG: MATE family efflux transporter, partial [Clostridium sp.]|nr:MATE family efflux transporter [Clostridium sp.]
VSDQTKSLVIFLVLIHNLFSALVLPLAAPLGSGLRATGDVKFTMLVSIASTIGGRFVFSILFGVVLDLGVLGIAYAMCLDWVIRAVIFFLRASGERWKHFQVI